MNDARKETWVCTRCGLTTDHPIGLHKAAPGPWHHLRTCPGEIVPVPQESDADAMDAGERKDTNA